MLSLACVFLVAKAEERKQQKFIGYINDMKSFEADYQQEVIGRKGAVISTNKGRLMFKSPGLFRWQSQDNSLTINDGQFLWQFDPDLEQVIKTDISKSEQGSSIIAIIAIINNTKLMDKYYNIELNKKSYHSSKYCLTDKLDPKNKIWLSFNSEKLTKIEYYDSLQNLCSIKFSSIKYNKEISSKWFAFIPDPSLDIIEQ